MINLPYGSFNNVPNFGEIVVYDTEKQTWNEIITNGNRPEWRYDHSLVYYKVRMNPWMDLR